MVHVETAFEAFRDAVRRLPRGRVAVDLTDWDRIDVLTLTSACRLEAEDCSAWLSLGIAADALRRLAMPADLPTITKLVDGVESAVTHGAADLVLSFERRPAEG